MHAALHFAPVEKSREQIVARLVRPLLCLFVRSRDVGNGAFEVQGSATAVAHETGAVHDDDAFAVLVTKLHLAAADFAGGLELAPPGEMVFEIRADLRAEIEFQHLVFGGIAQQGAERRVDGDHAIVARGLVDTGRRAFKHGSVARFRGAQRKHGVRAFERKPQHLVEQCAADFILDEVVERSAAGGFDAEVFVGTVDEHDNGHRARLALESQECGQPHAVAQRHVEDRRGEARAAHLFDAFGERSGFDDGVRASAQLFESACTRALRGPGIFDEQDLVVAHSVAQWPAAQVRCDVRTVQATE